MLRVEYEDIYNDMANLWSDLKDNPTKKNIYWNWFRPHSVKLAMDVISDLSHSRYFPSEKLHARLKSSVRTVQGDNWNVYVIDDDKKKAYDLMALARSAEGAREQANKYLESQGIDPLDCRIWIGQENHWQWRQEACKLTQWKPKEQSEPALLDKDHPVFSDFKLPATPITAPKTPSPLRDLSFEDQIEQEILEAKEADKGINAGFFGPYETQPGEVPEKQFSEYDPENPDSIPF